jgi:hypothetical protein
MFGNLNEIELNTFSQSWPHPPFLVCIELSKTSNDMGKNNSIPHSNFNIILSFQILFQAHKFDLSESSYKWKLIQ